MRRRESAARFRFALNIVLRVTMPLAASSFATAFVPTGLAAQSSLGHGTIHGTVIDRANGEPIPAVRVSLRDYSTETDQRGRFTLDARDGDTLRVRRIGYRPAEVIVTGDTLRIMLGESALSLESVTVRDSARSIRSEVTRTIAASRAAGAVSLPDALMSLPFLQSRSARGGVTLSMRGGRSEQLLVTLNGVPLNDPLTGVASVGDIPLSALSAITVRPGAPEAREGSGTGVLALRSASSPEATFYAGSFGLLGASGAASTTVGGAHVRLGAEVSEQRNDYPFLNTVASPPRMERRVNEDSRRTALIASAVTPSVSALLLASRQATGLGGPMNVSRFDRARGATGRALGRVALEHGGVRASIALRALDYRYRDSGVAEQSAQSASADAGLAGRLGPLEVTGGLGADRVRVTAREDSIRPRAFLASQSGWSHGRWRASLGLRADAIHGAGTSISPSLSVERRDAVSVFARVSQSIRAPTFYDLYFATPQRIDAPPSLRPERTLLNVELGARAARSALALSASVYARRTRDAIVWFPGTFVWSPQNAPLERSLGAEARATWQTEALTVEAWGGARDTRVRPADEAASVLEPYVPRLDGGALLTLRHERWTLSSTLQFVGQRAVVALAAPPPAEILPPVALTNATISWHGRVARAGALQLSTGVHNLGDARWQPIDRFPAPGRSWVFALTLSP